MPAIPKRTEDRMGHRTQAEQTVDKVVVGGPVRIPEPDEDWHPIALFAWEAFKASPLNIYYTETDMAFGWMTCDAIDAAYLSKSAMKIQAAESMMRNGLFNEADRRRIRIEVTRQEPETNPTVDKNVTDFRARRRQAETG
jgi:hypothetical protein